MTEKRIASEKQPYGTPSLVRYGSLFTSTGKGECSDIHSDFKKGTNIPADDTCDKDGGPADIND